MSSQKLSLLETRASILPKTVDKYEPAHVSRYLITARLISQLIGTNKSYKVLDVGGKKGLLREFGIKSTILDQENSNEKDFVKANALNMPFKDHSFDVVVSCDVLEHIPFNKREKFIDEMIRVSRGYVIIGAPFNQRGVSESEKAANKFYKSITDNDHRWLIEHIENGLPDINKIEAYLKKRKVYFKHFRHLSLDVWDLTTQIHFLNAVFGDSNAIKNFTQKAYESYYKLLCELDFSENGYRTFIVINSQHDFTIQLPRVEKQHSAKGAYKNLLNQSMLACIKGLGEEIRGANEGLAKQVSKQFKTVIELHSALNEIRIIKGSRSWKLVSKLSKMKNFYNERKK